jgi:hypothetical protein
MGHSSVTVTLDRYGHLYDGLDERIADGHDGALRASSRGLTAAWSADHGSEADAQRDNTAGQDRWALRDSNPRPPPCKGGALAN